MDKIYVILGKTLSGKTTLQNKLIEQFNLSSIIVSTTRPIRNNEINGQDYYFVDDVYFNEQNVKSNIVLDRQYKVKDNQIWKYFITKDELFKDNSDKILIIDYIGYEEIKSYIKLNKLEIKLIPIYLDIDLKTRLNRLINLDRFEEDHLEILRRLYKDELAFKNICQKSPEIIRLTKIDEDNLNKIFNKNK